LLFSGKKGDKPEGESGDAEPMDATASNGATAEN